LSPPAFDGLLQEERVPALDQALLERREPGIVAEERLQQLPALSTGSASSRIWP